MKNQRIQATTLSMILSDSDSVHCYLKIGRESCNVTLRFDQGPSARVCGYPMSWGVYDVNVEYYNYESPTYEDLESEGLLDVPVYVSRETEEKILIKLKKSIEEQFADPFWKDHSTPTEQRKTEILEKIQHRLETIFEEAS